MDSLYSLASYTYTLPHDLIAEEAIHPHHDARLMIVDRETGDITDETTFWHLDEFLEPDRVLFLNDSRVLPARIPLKSTKIERADGSQGIIQNGEILFCKKIDASRFEALVRPGTKFRINTKIYFPPGYLEVVALSDTGRIFETHGTTIDAIMRDFGQLPLPPYIQYSKEKEKDYQTVFAKNEGSVAAPTASLHFTKELLEKIANEKQYVTLHVGLGTFKGIDVSDIREYQIHGETIEVDLSLFSTIATLKQTGKKLVAVGTTACRTLESLAHLWNTFDEERLAQFDEPTRAFWKETQKQADRGYIDKIHFQEGHCFFETSIYLYPGKSFLIVDELITNFHLPESSLLVLVSAFIGQEPVEKIYKYAIKNRYRFFSF